jgi:iron(III) transport system ATP-binding protein
MNLHAEPAIRARDLTKSYAGIVALDRFSVDVWPGGVLTLLGPSGCGKTTALRIIAGFERPDAGTVDIDGTPVVGGSGEFVPPERRRVGMVFQDYALFPHMTVGANVGYGIERRPDRRRRVNEVLELVGLHGLEDRMPHELSGGQQQRVALARALAPEPGVILLDEPFSNLDAGLRDRVRRELREILVEARTTTVFVTHDQEEALAMSDIVAVMRDGRVLQAAPPDELYLRPLDPWVAGFLGDADFLTGYAAAGVVETPIGTFPCDRTGPVKVMVRPEAVHVFPDPDGDLWVADREFFGHDQMLTLAMAGGGTLRARLGPRPHLERNDRVRVKVDEAITFPA